jgi:excisionase family DNA binding protein
MQFFTVQDVVRTTGIGLSTAHLHIQRGNLPATMVGHTYLIKPEDFRAFVAARLTGKFTKQWRKAQPR